MNELEKEIYAGLFTEGGDDFDVEKEMGDMPDFGKEAGDDVDNFLDAIQTGDTGDELTDDDLNELDELEKEFNIAAAASTGATAITGDTTPATADDPIDELSPEDDELGDKMLASTVTPDLLSSTLSDDEFEDFIESGDMYTAAGENFISDSFIMEAMDADATGDLFTEDARFAPAGKKFKMTKAARFRQLYEISLQIEARLHHDARYPKMMKIYEIRRKIRGEWRKRYHALAMKRAKKYLKNLMKSNSSGLKKLAARLIGGNK